jgi:hypothetical protein
MHVEQPAMTVAQFEALAQKFEEESRLQGLSVEDQEEKFWKSCNFQPPLYGADMLGTKTYYYFILTQP